MRWEIWVNGNFEMIVHSSEIAVVMAKELSDSNTYGEDAKIHVKEIEEKIIWQNTPRLP